MYSSTIGKGWVGRSCLYFLVWVSFGSFSLREFTCMHCVYLALWTRKVLCGSFLCAIYKFSFIHSFIHYCYHSFYLHASSSSTATAWLELQRLHSQHSAMVATSRANSARPRPTHIMACVDSHHAETPHCLCFKTHHGLCWQPPCWKTTLPLF